MSPRSLAFCLLVIVIWSSSEMFPQDAGPIAKRPKLGLALEGGAALGLAHIGVLQWLEEHRIPVSYVAGTSMGGLVGGIFATGKSSAEIRALVEQIDWDEVLHGGIPFQDLAYRRKEDAETYPNGLEFGIKEGIRFPEGFNSGHQVGLTPTGLRSRGTEILSFGRVGRLRDFARQNRDNIASFYSYRARQSNHSDSRFRLGLPSRMERRNSRR